MPQFNVDDDLAALVEKLAEPRPFEHLSFNSALRKVLIRFSQLASEKSESKNFVDLEELLAESMALMKAKPEPKKAPSPSAKEWAASVPELKKKRSNQLAGNLQCFKNRDGRRLCAATFEKLG